MITYETIDPMAAQLAIIDMKGGVLTETDMIAVNSCVSHAAHTWLCYGDGVPVAAWGLVPPTFLADKAYLWLHAGPGLDAHKFLFIRQSQRVMEEMLRLYPSIYGVCEEFDARAQRWVRWLGGTFGPTRNGYTPFFIEARPCLTHSQPPLSA